MNNKKGSYSFRFQNLDIWKKAVEIGMELFDIADELDNYCFENKLERIHLLKVDVEGHEMEVLRGGEVIFSSNAIEMVLFEFGGCNIDTRTFLQDFFYFFREQHMNLYRITPSGYLYPLESYKEMQEQFITTNFLAMRGALH